MGFPLNLTDSDGCDVVLRDVMTTKVFSVAPNSLIEEALEIMVEKSISGLPVLNSDGTLAGILSEYDAVMMLFEMSGSNNPIAPVVQFMTQDVCTVDINQSLDDVLRLFSSKGIRRVPVMDQGRVVGIVSRRDLVRVIRDQRQMAIAEWSVVGPLE